LAAGVPAESLAAAALTLGRRFATGATMWCVAGSWASHGRHVAVEFVHPVIVGKRALPAVYVEDPEPADVLRLLARPGDVLLVIGPADERSPRLLRRAEAWGLTTLWLGAGPRPAPTAADHVVWSPNPDPARAARSGDVVILYHLLWELTHVVFEHPGLLSGSEPVEGPVCTTCSDQGVVVEVLDVDGDRADVLAGGRRETVDVSLVGPVRPGDLVLVHAGTAIASLEAER
jgi:hypothetical protein